MLSKKNKNQISFVSSWGDHVRNHDADSGPWCSEKGQKTWPTILALSLLSMLAIAPAPLIGRIVPVLRASRFTVAGRTTPYVWAVSGGQLRAGLTLEPASEPISGTPTHSGNLSFSAQLDDSSSPLKALSATIA